MAIFRYKLLNRSGKIVSEVADFSFDNVAAVHDYFERDGRSVIYVRPVSRLIQWWYMLLFALSYRRISSDEVAEFIRSLAVMLKAGVPLIASLEDAAEYLNNSSLTRAVADLKLSIESGISLSQAMEKHPKLFPDSVIYMARMGEETGLLDNTLMDAAENMRRISRIGVDVRKALIYPVFALCATLAALIFWLQFTVPSLSDLYKMMQVDLPAATQMVITLSESIQDNLLLYIIVMVATVVIIAQLVQRNETLRYGYHQLQLNIPVIKMIVSYSNMTFIFEYFSLLLRSGVDAYATLGVIGNSVNNEVYRRALVGIRDGVARGNSVSDEILKRDIFPRFVGRMVKTGEISGSLDEQMRFVADEYRQKLTDVIDRLKTLVEPVAIIVIGGLMLIIIGALFFPIYQLIGTIGVAGGPV